MKPFIIFILLIGVLSCTKDKNYSLEVVDGVKFINNKNTPSNPSLKYSLSKTLEINFYDNDNQEIENFKYPIDFDIDRDKNIYILDIMTSEVKKFDKNGKYLKSFSRQGNGPGESLYPSCLFIDRDTVYISNRRGKSFIKYSLDGKYIGDNKLDFRLPSGAKPIGNNYIGSYDDYTSVDNTPSRVFRLALFNDKMEMIESLYDYDVDIEDENFYNNVLDIFPPYAIGDSLIYVSANSEVEYKIYAYNFNGDKREVYSKQYREKRYSKSEKDDIIKMINMKEELISDIPQKSKKSITDIVYEDKNSIWVMTPGDNPRDSLGVVVDIFKKGIFQNRFKFSELETHCSYSYNLFYKIKNGYLYQLSNKEGNLKVFKIEK
ncbi:MAG: hypothetical protein CR982_01920 [Candidatus Cloacimonadota bacterium]|nr:MAG: hypothetical protein CR982_01920 [Candidatus Cloacimonadota bacterium]PIE78895.1 MAG: hypothetical protein CSA15_05435 [Candidatus Delongbacteria bacterium]